jgi:hypothetical protein
MSFTIPGQTQRSRAKWVTARSTHHIYRCYDAEGVLLYIGCTSDVQKRMGSHRRGNGTGASVWLAVCMARYEIDADAYPNKVAGLDAEREAILGEVPVFNYHYATRQRGGYAQRCRVAHYLIDHGHLDLAVATCCTCWREVRESGAYMDTCVAHVANPGDLPPFDWDAAEAAEERELQEWDAVAAAVTFRDGAA